MSLHGRRVAAHILGIDEAQVPGPVGGNAYGQIPGQSDDEKERHTKGEPTFPPQVGELAT